MKKFIIAMCGIFLFGGAFAAVTVVNNDIKNAWLYDPSAQAESVINQYTIKKNNTYNFEYVNIAAADKIYEHGARFCRMMLQHNYGTWKVYKEPSTCITICKEGYYGDGCTKTSLSKSDCNDTNLDDNFDTDTSSTARIESDIDGFFSSESGTLLLQIISATEHSVTVAIRSFVGTDGKHKQITEIYKAKNGTTFLLCAQGYRKSGNSCVLNDTCKYSNVVDSDDPTTSCGNGKNYERYGPSQDGACLDCWASGKNKIYSKSQKQCVSASAYSTKQMKYGQGDENTESEYQCWTLTDPKTYDVCVRGI